SVVNVSPVVDARRRVQSVRLAFSGNPAPAGLSGYLVWRSGQPVVGTQHILRRGEQLGLFLVDNGRARFHALEGAQEGRATAVDLPGSTLIITNGALRLQDGDAVTVAP
ncbi:MAG: efflux RND transporter periplasmic adaptor subunit, partial [Pseudomonadota bacterium]